MNGLFQVAGSLFPELARLQQVLDEASPVGSSAGIRAMAGRSYPAINVGSTPDSIEVIAFVPGIDPKEIEITIDRGLLSLVGQRTTSADRPDGTHTYAQERFEGRFRRVIALPEDADPGKVEAKCRDGILHIKVAKRESSKPRQITIS
jgi:HSP20 family protein